MRYGRMYTRLVLPIVLVFAIVVADDDDTELESEANKESQPKVTVVLTRILDPAATVKSPNTQKVAANKPAVSVTLTRLLRPDEKERAKKAATSQIQLQAKLDEKLCNQEIYEK